MSSVLLLAGAIVALDQVSKAVALDRLPLGVPVPLVDGLLALTLVLNPGLAFGLLGSQLAHWEGLLVPATVVLLCFIMGLQNAVITKLSNAVIRTTHMTGIVTDLGIELGKLLYWNRVTTEQAPVLADRARMAVLAGLFACFLGGGLAGAYGFKAFGYRSTLPLALLLAALAAVPALDDLRQRWGRAAP